MVLFADSQEFPSQCHRTEMPVAIVCGPVWGVMTLSEGFHWQWKPYTKEQRWVAYQAEFGNSDREWFEHWSYCGD